MATRPADGNTIVSVTTSHAVRIAEIETELCAIRAARLKIVATGQAYTAEGRQMTRANLRDLRDLEKDLMREQSMRQRNGRIRTFGVVMR